MLFGSIVKPLLNDRIYQKPLPDRGFDLHSNPRWVQNKNSAPLCGISAMNIDRERRASAARWVLTLGAKRPTLSPGSTPDISSPICCITPRCHGDAPRLGFARTRLGVVCPYHSTSSGQAYSRSSSVATSSGFQLDNHWQTPPNLFKRRSFTGGLWRSGIRPYGTFDFYRCRPLRFVLDKGGSENNSCMACLSASSKSKFWPCRHELSKVAKSVSFRKTLRRSRCISWSTNSRRSFKSSRI